MYLGHFMYLQKFGKKIDIYLLRAYYMLNTVSSSRLQDNDNIKLFSTLMGLTVQRRLAVRQKANK